MGERVNGTADTGTAGVTDARIDRDFNDGSILRTHLLRPTWHFVVPADIRWLLALTAPRVHALNAYSYRKLELGEAVRGRSEELLAGALAGHHLTRTEIATVLARAGIAPAGLRLGYILMSAELNGLISSGPRRAKHHTYTLLDERAPVVPSASALDRDEALGRLARRYFESHGPATARDCAYWSSLSVADVKRGLEISAAQLRQETFADVEYQMASSAPPPPPASARVHLLQGYDEFLVAYSESKYVLDASGAARSQPPQQGVFNHVLVNDGQVAGRWRRTQKKSAVVVEVAPYAPLDTAAIRALQDAATRHGRFFGLPATVLTG